LPSPIFAEPDFAEPDFCRARFSPSPISPSQIFAEPEQSWCMILVGRQQSVARFSPGHN